VSTRALKAGYRFVSITRRNYPGSTALSEADIGVLTAGSEEDKNAFLKARGVEIATFISKFIEKESLPAITDNGTGGGIALIGWSLGNSFSLASISHLDALPEEDRTRVGSRLRALIMQGKL
jgi:hypothetical protein